MLLWLIPSFDAVASIVAELLVPRLEARLLASGLDLSTSPAQACLPAVASGMTALTGIVVSILWIKRESGEERP